MPAPSSSARIAEITTALLVRTSSCTLFPPSCRPEVARQSGPLPPYHAVSMLARFFGSSKLFVSSARANHSWPQRVGPSAIGRSPFGRHRSIRKPTAGVDRPPGRIRCSRHGAGQPYHPVAHLLRRDDDPRGGEPPDQLRR